MKHQNVIIIGCAAIIGLGAAFVSSQLSVKTDSPMQQQAAAEDEKGKIEVIEVAVAKKDLPLGAVIQEDDFTLQTFAKMALPSDVVREIKDLKNKRLYRSIQKGSFISSREAGAVVEVKIPDGMYKYSMNKVFTDLSEFVQPGDKVDIIYTEASLGGKFKASTKLRDLLVLAVNIPTSRSFDSRSGETSGNPFTVSLAVTEEQSLLLASYEKRGEVRMVVREPAN
jgi:Flp pilus assembly protein CpaB